MFRKFISYALIILLIGSCASKAVKETPKEDEATAAAQAEELKLPELPQKPRETEIKKPVEQVRVEKEPDGKYVVLNFDNADIETVISTISELLNMNYILSPGITGKVTIQSYRKFPVKDLYQIFQTILEINGITAVKDGTLYRIVPIDTAKQQPLTVGTGKELKLQLDSSFITQIIPLEYVKANDIVNVLRNLMPRGADLIVYEPTNLLVVTAPPAALVKFMKILDALDIPATDRESIRTFVYYVEHGDAKKLAETLNKLYVEKKDKRTTPAIRPAAPAVQPKVPGATATTVEGLPGEVEGEIVITTYEDINCLVIKASPANYLTILEILKRLDISAKQVLIEVLIAEITLTDATQFGIEWLLKSSLDIRDATFKTLSGFDTGTPSEPRVLVDSVTKLYSSPFFSAIRPDKFSILINAFASIGKVNVLASPHILAMDNKEAKIEIGEDIPTATGFQQSPATTTVNATSYVAAGQIQYRTAGVILTVTPHISEKKQVTLKINQEISSKGADQSVAGILSPTFTTRKANTTAVVQDGHTLVIGGLISEQKNEARSGIPFLSDIPIIGYLFGVAKEDTKKTELVVMVTPHVVGNQDEADILTKEFQNKVKTIKERLEEEKIDILSISDNIVTIEVEKDSQLTEIIESAGYAVEDKELNAFLKDFITLNENVKSINSVPAGTKVKLPVAHLKKIKK